MYSGRPAPYCDITRISRQLQGNPEYLGTPCTLIHLQILHQCQAPHGHNIPTEINSSCPRLLPKCFLSLVCQFKLKLPPLVLCYSVEARRQRKHV